MKMRIRITIAALFVGLIFGTAKADVNDTCSVKSPDILNAAVMADYMPFYTHTYSIFSTLSFEGNKAKCSGQVTPIGNDFVSITVTLYKKNGTGWDYIDSWNGEATGGGTAYASGSVNVSSGTYKVVANGNVGNKEYPSASDTKTKP